MVASHVVNKRDERIRPSDLVSGFDSPARPHLLRAKVTVPEPSPGYLYRRSLMQCLDSVTDHRVTVLRAAAGFGKTTNLAEISRRKREQGLVVGWVSVDEDDTPSVLGRYIAYALECAGVDPSTMNDLDAWQSTAFTHLIGVLAGAIESQEMPCTLVFDDVHRVPRRTVAFLDLLTQRGPRNLHVVFAFRTNPGLDLSTHIVNGSGLVIDTERLRFSRSEVARFFGGDLSRRELDEVMKRTTGWPFALSVDRLSRATESGRGGVVTKRVTANFLAVRLLRELSTEERACILDLALFDWIDEELLSEVLGVDHARRVLAAMSYLDGFLFPLGHDGRVQQLHPIVKRYCSDRLSAENPVRERSLRVGIARALAARDYLVEAWRHASNARDDLLVGDLIERAGVFRLWLRDGMMQLISAERFLTPGIVKRFPRLALLRCIVLRLGGKLGLAATEWERIERTTSGFARDREGGDGILLFIDAVFTRAVLNGGGCHRLQRQLDKALPVGRDGAGTDGRDRFLTAAWHTLECVACYERALFMACREHGLAAEENFVPDVRYGRVYVSIYLGMAAMAQGRVEEATRLYRRARELTKRFLSTDACLAVVNDVLMIEIDLERNRVKAIEQRTLSELTELRGAWVDLYSAAVSVSAELTQIRHGAEATVRLLATTCERVRNMGFESTFVEHVSALHITSLLECGRVDEAAQAWRDAGLSTAVPELVDFEGRPWRALEAVACGRVRLLAAQGDSLAAAELAARLFDASLARGLVRTALRSLAVCMEVAERAGQPEHATARLVEYLRLMAATNYVGPLVRCRDVSRAVVQRLLVMRTEPDVREAAVSVLVHLAEPVESPAPDLSPRELEVLVELRRGGRNKEIATRLGISDAGVRFHLKNIYRKLGVKGRKDAIRGVPEFARPDDPERDSR